MSNNNHQLEGIVPSLHTPFTADNQLDEPSLTRLVEHTINSGCRGILVGAVAGESDSLTVAEKQRVIEVSVESAGGKIPVIAGISSPTPANRLMLAQTARAAGAQWMLCQPPAALSGDQLVRFFEPLCAHGPDRLMIQDLSWSGYGMALEDILKLHGELPGFQSLKIEVVPAGPKYSEVIAATEASLHVCGGWAIMTMIESMRRGVNAFIPSTMDPIYCKIFALQRSGQETQARELFQKILPVLAFTHQHIHISIAFSKMLRVHEKLFATAACRAPIAPLDEHQQHETSHWIEHIIRVQQQLG